jgi:IS5 family transposase
MRKALKRLKGYTGRVMRDRRCHLKDIPTGSLRDRIIAKLAMVSQLLHKQPKGADNFYALHEPQVDCIFKGKARVRYEFGCKVSLATTLDEGFVVGMRSFPGNPYDGHTLCSALEQVTILTDQRPELAVVDRGYRGLDEVKTRVLISGTRRGLTPKLVADLRRRSATEAEIGHMKTDGRLSRSPFERHHRRRPLRRPLRLRPQHPKDPGPPQALACLGHRRPVGPRNPALPTLSHRRSGVNALFRANERASTALGHGEGWERQRCY